MRAVKPFKWKLCLIGESAVGKTSLIRRFVFDQFDDRYLTTIGTKITKKKMKIQNPINNGWLEGHLMIWDIIGQAGFRHLLQEAYFFGVQGIIVVCDVTRKSTLSELESWMEAVQSVVDEEIPIVFLGNKCDLVDEQQVDLDELKTFALGYEKTETYLSSAKTGLNVELVFKTVSDEILKDSLESDS